MLSRTSVERLGVQSRRLSRVSVVRELRGYGAAVDLMMGVQQELIDRIDLALRLHRRPQKSLAKAVGISEKHLSQILNAKAWPPAALWDRLLFEAEKWPKTAALVTHPNPEEHGR
jgi:hypothetical protein